MSRAILLVICDFLLLSLLALANFDKPKEEEHSDAQAEQVQEQAHADLVEVLQMSLESEQSAREALNDELDQRDQALLQKEEEIRQREALAANLKQNIDQLESSKKTLEEQRQELQAQQQKLQQNLQQQEDQLRQQAQQSNLVQEDLAVARERLRMAQQQLQEKQQALASRESELKNLSQELVSKEREQAILSTQLESANVVKQRLEVQLETERVAKQAAEQHAATLAGSVSDLATSSDAIREEFVRNTPLSLNEIFDRFNRNRLTVGFATQESTLLGSVSKRYLQAAVPIVYQGQAYALFAVNETPFNASTMKRLNSIRGQIAIGEKRYEIPMVSLLQADHRIVLIRIPSSFLAEASITPFTLESDALRFPEAVLVTAAGDKYGEAPFRIHVEDNRYFEMESKLFSRLFGDFSPSGADFVFSKNGQLLGVMVDSRLCLLLAQIAQDVSIPLGAQFNASVAAQIAESFSDEDAGGSVRKNVKK
ncbi:MAG: hypothetical protein JW739_02770 [Opitutales bacterium]|nr:hypothetical protein [Opitutales bacterium]